MSRIAWYVALNAVFAIAAGMAGLSGSVHGVHPLYLIVLFALCTSFIIDIRHWNDRYALLAMFSAVYFQFYGIIDLETLFGLYPDVPSSSGSVPLLSEAEILILIGGALAQVGYRLACRPSSRGLPVIAYDWSEASLLWLGVGLFVVCSGLKWIAHVVLFFNNDPASQAQELARVGNAGMFAITLGDTLQPLSMLLIFYALSRFRRPLILSLAIGVVLFQAVYGFIIDVKGEVMIGAVMLVVTKVLVEGRLPKAWLASFAVAIVLLFPALQANRVVRGENGVNRAQAAHNVLQTFTDAYAARRDVTTGENRTQTLFERASLKGSIDMIVLGTGKSVPYQDGATLTPIVAAFIPKFIWPSKPSLEVGRILNRQFHVNDDPDTYISPSHLGELYWNFGWAGVVAGMSLIGLLLGYVGARCDLSEAVTVTRTLVVAGTARLLILGFESSISNQYVMWARVVLAIAAFHFLFARSLASRKQSEPDGEAPSVVAARPFGNLMT